MYGDDAEQRLTEKLDYEFWLLEFMCKTQDLCHGIDDISTIKLTRGENDVKIFEARKQSFEAHYQQRVLSAFAPLTFIAAYKVLDMVYEWILEENKEAGIIRKVPWRFNQKIKTLNSATIKYPPLFVAEPYLQKYSYRLYDLLLRYRNEIVHNHNVNVEENTISITSSEDKTTLCLNDAQQTQLVRFVVSIAQCLTAQRTYDDFLEILLRCHLDQLAFIHKLPVFDQELSLTVNVELIVIEEGGCFQTDLNFVRERVARIYPHSTVLFNLKIIGTRSESVVAVWDFPADCVPSSDTFKLDIKSHQEYRSQLALTSTTANQKCT